MIHVRLAERTPTAQAALVVLDLLVGVLAILGTAVALLAAALAAHAIRAGVGHIGWDPAFAAVGAHLVALATLLLLFASVRFVVVEYRRFLDHAPGPARPVLLALGPLAGVAVPFGYAAFATDSLRPPWFLLGLAVVSTHALAYRALSSWSRTTALARLGELGGVVAGIPLIVALVTFLTEGVLFGPLDDAGRLLLATPGWELVPRDGRFLVAFPLFVTTTFGVYRSLWKGDRVDVPGPDLPRVGAPVPDGWVRAVERRIPVPTLTDLALTATDRLGDYVADRRRHTDGAVPPDAPPVPTPIGSRGNRSDSAGRDAPSGSPRESVDLGPRPLSPSSDSRSSSSSSSSSPSESGPSTSNAATATSNGSAGSAREPSPSGSDTPRASGKKRAAVGPEEVNASPDTDDVDSGSEAAESDDSPSATDTSSTSNSDGTPSANGPADGSSGDEAESSACESSAEDEGDAGSQSDGSASPAPAEGDDSQTRIYTPEPGEAAPSDGATVETCPECDADVPSDGTYVFCPLCGNEL